MDSAMNPPGKESPVVDFAIEPLRTVRTQESEESDGRRLSLSQRHSYPHLWRVWEACHGGLLCQG